MIRELQKADITKVADIWLDTNIKAHILYLRNTGKVIMSW